MATMKVSLPEPAKTRVEDQKRKEALIALQVAITEGVESGNPQLFDAAAFKRRMREKHVVR